MRSVNRENVEGLWLALGNSADEFNHSVHQFRHHVQNLARALDQMDLERIHLECHSLNRISRDLGATHLYEIVCELESVAIGRDVFRIRQIRTRCEEEMFRVLGDLGDFLHEKSVAA